MYLLINIHIFTPINGEITCKARRPYIAICQFRIVWKCRFYIGLWSIAILYTAKDYCCKMLSRQHLIDLPWPMSKTGQFLFMDKRPLWVLSKWRAGLLLLDDPMCNEAHSLKLLQLRWHNPPRSCLIVLPPQIVVRVSIFPPHIHWRCYLDLIVFF